MDRIIEVKVGGNYIRKDKKTAGVRGEYEVAILRIEFDESWDEYEKRITFWDARGLQPVFRTLDATRLENHSQSKRVFLVPIPVEPMSVAGEMTFVIDGIVDGKKQRSMSDKLEVKDAPMSDDALPPTESEKTVVEQMMAELGRIEESISEAIEAKEDILNMTVESETLETGEAAFVRKTENEGVAHLHFGLPKGNTGDSGVYIGDEAPIDPAKNVWIEPDETLDAKASILRIKNENGTWHDIPTIRGLSAYEIALKNGFVGSEEEWINKVEAEARMAEEARVSADAFADKALQSAQNAAISEESAYTQSNRAYSQAERAMEYANAAGESATSAHDFAVQAEEQQNLAREYALASDESATSSHTFAEEAKESADKAEQHANEMSGVLPNIEAGLSLRPTMEQVKAMHEEEMSGIYNIRKIPEGKTIDDLYLEEDYGLYMIDDECPFAEMGFTSRGSQLIVTGGYYYEEGFGDKSTTCQVLLCHDGSTYVIKQRSLQNGRWSDWEDQFATKYDVSKLTYFKKVPYGKSIDDLYGEEHLGWYMGKVKSNFNNEYNPNEDFHFLFVNDGWTITDIGDMAYYFQTRFIWDGFNYRIQTRKGSGGDWSDWQDAFGGGGEVKYFPYEPQLDITLQEGVQKILVNELDGKSWSDFKFTAVKVLVENAVLETAGPNTQVCVYINSRGYTSTQTVLGSPTTFINGTKKQYWSCYADLKSGLMISCDASTTNELWVSGISMPINMQRLNLKNILEYISIEYMNTNGVFPVGTRFRIWLR